MEDKIKRLGENFRGLWRSYEFKSIDDDVNFDDKWYVTFVYKGRYVETPAYNSIDEALNFALSKLKL